MRSAGHDSFFCVTGKGNADVSQEGSAAVYYDIPEKGTDEEGSKSTGETAGDDPAQVVAKALLCFNDKHVSSVSSSRSFYVTLQLPV